MADNNELPTPESPTTPTPVSSPRRKISAERQVQADPVGDEDAVAHFVDGMKVLAESLLVGGTRTDEAAKDRSGRRIKKFQRRPTGDEKSGNQEASDDTTQDNEEPKTSLAVADSGKRDDAAFNRAVAWPSVTSPDGTEYNPGGSPNPLRKKPSKRLILNVVKAAGVGLLLLGFLLGRETAPTGEEEAGTSAAAQTPRPPVDAEQISEPALQAVDAALLTAYKGDLTGARKLLNQLLVQHPEVSGVQYELSQLAIRDGDSLDGDLHLDRSSGAGEFLAACCYTRARFAGTKGKYSEVTRQFEAAVHEEPFNAASFFYWGEALRREGQPKAAIDVFDRALTRAHTTAEDKLYIFKQRLARVEMGNDEAFEAELTTHAKETPVDGDWLLLDAARNILHSALPAAAESLKRAATALPASVYDLRVKDYLFQGVAKQPVLTPLLQRPIVTDSTEVNAQFMDPSIISPTLADPAIWPVGLAR